MSLRERDSRVSRRVLPHRYPDHLAGAVGRDAPLAAQLIDQAETETAMTSRRRECRRFDWRSIVDGDSDRRTRIEAKLTAGPAVEHHVGHQFADDEQRVVKAGVTLAQPSSDGGASDSRRRAVAFEDELVADHHLWRAGALMSAARCALAGRGRAVNDPGQLEDGEHRSGGADNRERVAAVVHDPLHRSERGQRGRIGEAHRGQIEAHARCPTVGDFEEALTHGGCTLDVDFTSHEDPHGAVGGWRGIDLDRGFRGCHDFHRTHTDAGSAVAQADSQVGNASSGEPGGIESTSLFPSAIETPAAVRRFVRNVTAARISNERAEDVDLLVSEVVTNAVKYGGGDFVRVTVAERGPGVRIDVTDHSSDPPRVVAPSADRTGGRGMLLVDRIASRWGIEPIHGIGKVVWFEL